MNKVRLLFAFVFLLSLGKVQAQDPQFSQFANTAHLTNPALIGVYDGTFRASLAYREQWNTVLGKQPYRTMAASADIRRPVLRGDFVGAGVVAMRDETGGSNFRQDRVYAGAAYMKKLGGRGRSYKGATQYLVAGGQLGVGQNSFSGPGLVFSDQFELNTPTVVRESQEDFSNLSTPMFLDFNAGLLYYLVFDQDQSFYVGGSVHHISEPNVAFLDGAESDFLLARKYSVQIGGELPIARNVTLLPAALGIRQAQSMRILAGTHFRYNSREWREVALRFGVWGSVVNKLESGILMDATVVSATLETERLDFGVSYDLNTSSLTQITNGRGAFEMTVTYKQPYRGRKLLVDCPRF
ncbi:MAG: PorP/SprF family type IX secretion system membrane protein [Bacteroidota bacterium]